MMQPRAKFAVAATLLAALLLVAAPFAFAGPFSFLFFWRHTPPPQASLRTGPPTAAEIAGLVSVTAAQKCENWAWAAALETALKAQHVNLSQDFWVMKEDGGELCIDKPADLAALAQLISGSYTVDDGRKVQLRAEFVQGAPTSMDDMVLAPMHGRPLIFFWKGHAYVYRGMRYSQVYLGTSTQAARIEQIELLDPFESGAKQEATFDPKTDDPNDINGLLDVKATFAHQPDWQHPANDLEHWEDQQR